jgi:hypothetical protein
MSGNQRGHAYIEQDGGYTISHPAPLRAPSDTVLIEVLRRHAAGDQTPVKSDGDLSWCSHTFSMDRGISPPAKPLQPERIADARMKLAEAIDARAAIQRQRVALIQAVAVASAEVEATQQRLDDLAGRDRQMWASWADGDHNAQPRPLPSEPIHRELTALHDAAIKRHIGAQAALDTAQDQQLQLEAAANSLVFEMQMAVLINVADEWRERRRAAMEVKAIGDAIVEGLSKFAAIHKASAAVTAIRQPAFSPKEAEQMVARVTAQQMAENYAKALLVDPEFKLEP